MKNILLLFVSLFYSLITIAQLNGDYRTKASGNWNEVSIWEKYNGTLWIAATSSPGVCNNLTINSGHSITINAPLGAGIGQLSFEVKGGGLLIINNSFEYRGMLKNYGEVIQNNKIYLNVADIFNYGKWIFNSNYVLQYYKGSFQNFDTVRILGGGSFCSDSIVSLTSQFAKFINNKYVYVRSQNNGQPMKFRFYGLGANEFENKINADWVVDSTISFDIYQSILGNEGAIGFLNNGNFICKKMFSYEFSIKNKMNINLTDCKISSDGGFENLTNANFTNVSYRCSSFKQKGNMVYNGKNFIDHASSLDVCWFSVPTILPTGTKLRTSRLEGTSQLTINDTIFLSAAGVGQNSPFPKITINPGGVFITDRGTVTDTVINFGIMIFNNKIEDYQPSTPSKKYIVNNNLTYFNWQNNWNNGSAQGSAYCSAKFVNNGTIVIDKLSQLWNNQSYVFSFTLENNGFIKGRGEILNFCSNFKGNFEPQGKISLRTNTPDSIDLKVRVYKLNQQVYTDTLESLESLFLGKKITVSEESSNISDGFYKIIRTVNGTISGVFQISNLPQNYFIKYEGSSVYVVKNSVSPPQPQISDIVTSICSNATLQKGKLVNPPLFPVTIQILQNNATPLLYNAADSSFTYSPGSAGNNTITVKYSNHISTTQQSINYEVIQAQTPIGNFPTFNPNPICLSQPVTFTAPVANIGSSPFVTWLVDGVVQPGATSLAFTTTFGTTGSRMIRYKITPNGGCFTSIAILDYQQGVFVNASTLPNISISGTTTITSGQSVLISSARTNAGSIPVYQWQDSTSSSGWLNINTGISSTINYTPLATGNKLRCQLTSNAVCANPASVFSNTIVFTVNTPTSIIDPQNPNMPIRITPNPASQLLNITGLSTAKLYHYVLSDYTGRSLLNGNISQSSQQQININTMPAGIYFLRLYSVQQKRLLGTEKIIVVH
jgi:Secretion system C-terminal sorting domain